MGIFIKSGILHTLSCHFWLNLWNQLYNQNFSQFWTVFPQFWMGKTGKNRFIPVYPILDGKKGFGREKPNPASNVIMRSRYKVKIIWFWLCFSSGHTTPLELRLFCSNPHNWCWLITEDVLWRPTESSSSISVMYKSVTYVRRLHFLKLLLHISGANELMWKRKSTHQTHILTMTTFLYAMYWSNVCSIPFLVPQQANVLLTRIFPLVIEGRAIWSVLPLMHTGCVLFLPPELMSLVRNIDVGRTGGARPPFPGVQPPYPRPFFPPYPSPIFPLSCFFSGTRAQN